MEKIAHFERVSFDQFCEGFKEGTSKEELKKMYQDLKCPKRATVGSAGYDFVAPFDIEIKPQETVKIPTGIRCGIHEGWVLMIFPRSGLGFKYRLQLNNTVGIIDSDYYYSDNEGHIFIKITNDSYENKICKIKKGEGFAQGIFVPFGICDDDEVKELRNGGFGSTTK